MKSLKKTEAKQSNANNCEGNTIELKFNIKGSVKLNINKKKTKHKTKTYGSFVSWLHHILGILHYLPAIILALSQ